MWEILKAIQWKEFRGSWFWVKHLPYMAKCIPSAIFLPKHKSRYYNIPIYDGLTRNQFRKGNLITFLGQIKAIKQLPESSIGSDDGRWYWIGVLDDE
jgi:hypothetical protein